MFVKVKHDHTSWRQQVTGLNEASKWTKLQLGLEKCTDGTAKQFSLVWWLDSKVYPNLNCSHAQMAKIDLEKSVCVFKKLKSLRPVVRFTINFAASLKALQPYTEKWLFQLVQFA